MHFWDQLIEIFKQNVKPKFWIFDGIFLFLNFWLHTSQQQSVKPFFVKFEFWVKFSFFPSKLFWLFIGSKSRESCPVLSLIFFFLSFSWRPRFCYGSSCCCCCCRCCCCSLGGRGLEIFVGRVLVSVHLHAGHVPLLGTGGLVHLDEALEMKARNWVRIPSVRIWSWTRTLARQGAQFSS